jgi:transposase-like protein
MNLERSGSSSVPEVEVLAHARRRAFTAEYKLEILRKLEKATERGAVGALLRREGLFRSQVAQWKAAQKRGELSGLKGAKRGRPAKARDGRDGRIQELERENRRLSRKLERAETLIELQKKVSELLGIDLPESDERNDRR